jgi:cytochrome c551/c552
MKNLCVFAFVVLLLITNSANANRELASSNGCMGCHADTKFDGPPWPELARKYKKFQGQPDAAQIEGEQLRRGGFFKKVKAHQKLSPEMAAELMQWIIDGAN